MERLRFPPHDLVIDEERFRALLAGSLSLMPIEKKRILESVPNMTQKQLDGTTADTSQRQAGAAGEKKHCKHLQVVSQAFFELMSLLCAGNKPASVTTTLSRGGPPYVYLFAS